MTDRIIASIRGALASLEGVDDDLLRAIAALAAHGNFQIIPRPPSLFGERGKPMMILPQPMYDRLLKVVAEAENHPRQETSD